MTPGEAQSARAFLWHARAAFVRRAWLPVLSILLALAARWSLPFIDPWIELTDPQLLAAQKLFTVLLVVAITWLLIRLVDAAEETLLARFSLEAPDNLEARRVHTQARVLSRSVQIVMIVLGLGAALMVFESIRQMGMTLLASAGVLGIVVGLATQSILANLFAGIQIALTQPIRLDDVVIIEGEWGRVEEITTAYVVVRIWDDRRLIVPLRRIIDQPFQNWTRTTSQLLGTVFLYCDYSVDLQALRAELTRLCESSDDWDRRVAIIQVTDATEKTMQVRALVSASSSSRLWDLRVLVREGLIAYLRDSNQDALPRFRASVSAENGVLNAPRQTEDAG